MSGSSAPRRGLGLNELGIIADGGLLIRDGLIEQVGTSRRLENLTSARDAVEISAVGRVVMPGFVDSHTHLMYPPPGSASGPEPDDAARRSLLASTGQRLARRGRGFLETMARHGTTTVEAKTGCGPDESAESKVLRVLGVLNRHPLDLIPTLLFRLPRGATLAEAESAASWLLSEFLSKIRRRRQARFVDIHWDPNPAFRGLFVRILVVARELGFKCKVHAEQAPRDEAISLAVEHGAVSIDHLEDVTPRQAALLAHTDTMATVLPCVLFGKGRCADARTLIDAGAALALATNFNPCHSPSLNMQTAISLACLNMRMTAAEALTAATVNGAHALGCAGSAGQLAPGASADVLFLNVSDYRDLPQQLGTNLVHITMKHGRPIYQEGAVEPRAG